MVDFGSILVAISTLFFLYLAVKSFLRIELCALCASVSTVWVILLGYRIWGGDVDPLALGILMGGSAVGLMYMLGAKMPERWNVLKLPFLLSLLALVYIVLTDSTDTGKIWLVLGFLWLIFLPIFLVGKGKGMGQMAKKIIECCKNW